MKFYSCNASLLAALESNLNEDDEIARLSSSKIASSCFFSMPQNGDQTQDLRHSAELKAQLSEIINSIRLLLDSEQSSEDLIYLR